MLTPFLAAALVQQTPEGQWGKSPLAPTAIAEKVDARLASLKNVTVKFRYDMNVNGDAGYVDAVGTVVSPTVFKVQVPFYRPTITGLPLGKEIYLADGKHFGSEVYSMGVPKPGAFAARSRPVQRPSSIWFLNFSQHIFSGLGRNTHPMSTLLADLQKLGFKTTAERRSLKFRGRTIISYRLTSVLGKVRYETVIDGGGFLPVMVTNVKGSDFGRWSGVMWNLHPTARDYAKDFTPKDIRFVKPGAIGDISPKRPQR